MEARTHYTAAARTFSRLGRTRFSSAGGDVMVYLYRRLNRKDGSRTWKKYARVTTFEDYFYLTFSPSPGMVYQTRFRKDELVRGTI